MNENAPNSRRPVWKQFGDDAAQLFRDFYFGKYPETIEPSKVYIDPQRPYRFYNKTSFYKHVKSIRNRVRTFKEFGTGVDNEPFLQKLRLHEEPSPEERKPTGLLVSHENNDDNYNSEDDETYKTSDGNEEDIDLPEAFEIESFLGNLSIQEEDWPRTKGVGGSIVDKKYRNKEQNRKMNAGTENSPDFNNDLGVKYLVQLPDGRLCALVYLPSGFDGYFMISEDGKKVIMKTKIPKVMISAERCFEKLGLGKQDAFVVHMQSKMNDLLETYKKENLNAEANNKVVVNEKTIFKLPFEVKRTFFNEKGDEDHQCQIGEYDGAEWSYFFMINANIQKISSPEPRMARDRSRRRESSNNSNRMVTISNINPHQNNNNSSSVHHTSSTRRRVDGEQFYSPRNMETTTVDDQYTYEDVSDDENLTL
jgi:hypothetical protein